MAILHPHLRQRLHAVAFKATHPAEFSDTLIVDGDTGQRTKGDERFAAGSTELGHAVVVWLCCTFLAVLIPALVLGVSWTDLIAWLAAAGDAIARGPL